jgi:hypothetical protein
MTKYLDKSNSSLGPLLTLWGGLKDRIMLLVSLIKTLVVVNLLILEIIVLFVRAVEDWIFVDMGVIDRGTALAMGCKWERHLRDILIGNVVVVRTLLSFGTRRLGFDDGLEGLCVFDGSGGFEAVACFIKLWGVGSAVLSSAAKQARFMPGVMGSASSRELGETFKVPRPPATATTDLSILRGVARPAAGGTLNLRGKTGMAGSLGSSSLSSMMMGLIREVPSEFCFAGPATETWSGPAVERWPAIETGPGTFAET